MEKRKQLDLNKVKIHDFYVGGEYPDFSDSYIEEAYYDDRPMSPEEMERLENDHPEWVYDKLINFIV